MRQKFWQTKEFKELEKEWYQRLERERFEDVEKAVSGELVLRQRSISRYNRAKVVEREAKQRYYELLGQALHEEKEFKDNVEKFVMGRKASGVTIVRICFELELMGEKRYRGTVRKIIQKYERRWYLKNE